MSKKARPFDAAAKARIMRAETAKHGHIRPGSFATTVQGKVDAQTRPPGTQTVMSIKRERNSLSAGAVAAILSLWIAEAVPVVSEPYRVTRLHPG